MAIVLAATNSGAEMVRLVVQPASVELTGADRLHGFLVTAIDHEGRTHDVTAQSKFSPNDPEVVKVSKKGECEAIADGQASVEVSFEGLKAVAAISASGLGKQPTPSFRQDILPILTTTGCNAGGCHGKLAGQNGFRLSLRGYAPEWDHEWITQEVNARRINVAFPEQSLLVRKPIGGVAHEGGTRFKAGTRYFQTLVDWIAVRAPGPDAAEEDASRLEVLPGSREIRPGEKQQLLVRAHYPSGRVRDVTWLAQFFSNDESIVTVKPSGLVKAQRHGETSVRVHFQRQVEVVRFTMPHPAEVSAASLAARNNVVDEPIFAKLAALHLPASALCTDQAFIRRAFLDTLGLLPTPEETLAFAADSSADKRPKLVDALLERSEWTDHWTLQLADLLQNRKERDHDVRGSKGVRAFHTWLRGQVAANRPWDQIARDVLLATGDSVTRPEIGYYITVMGEKDRVEDSELPDSVAQSFLGVRVGCARCHNHPLEKYTQDDFYRFSAYFSKVSLNRVEPTKGPSELTLVSKDERDAAKRVRESEAKLDEVAPLAAAYGLEPGGEDAAKKLGDRRRDLVEAQKRLTEVRQRKPMVNQPRTNQQMMPHPLDGKAWNFEAGRDPREQFVEWMLTSENFSGAMVNRLWKHFFNVGLVEPVDDLRASNPPSNSELWALLNREFVAHGYNLKHVMRLILNSRAYQLSSETVKGNETDTRFYSHYYARRLPAEVLLDAVASATDVPNAFQSYPLGMRAMQLPEPGVGSYFLSLFGRSERVTACACEKKGEVTLPQILHLQNSEDLQRQISDANGRLTALLRETDDSRLADGIFLATVSRPPTISERAALSTALAADSREPVFRDLFWALLNSKEFAFNH